MSDIITVSARSVNTITAEIIGIATQTASILLMSACEMGKRLIEAKELVDHGEWGDYLKGVCQQLDVSTSTAANWMRLYREYGDSPNFQALGNLNYTKAIQLLALPEETREEFVNQNNVNDMSSRELAQAIKEKQAAQEMLALAQESAAAAQQMADDQQKEIDKLNAALKKATAAEEKAKKQMADLKKNPPAIPAGEIEKIANDAADKARKEYEDQILLAQAKADAAEEARLDMEKALVEAQKQTQEMNVKLQLSGGDEASFELLYDQIVSNFNKMMGYLIKIEQASPETGAKLRFAARRMGEKFQEYADRKGGA